MLLQKPLGIFALLDEESRFPNSTPESFVNKIEKASKQCGWENFRKVRVASRKRTVTVTTTSKGTADRSTGPIFEINHYAGVVEYDSTEFLLKNRDNLSKDVTMLFKASEKSFLRQLFQ